MLIVSCNIRHGLFNGFTDPREFKRDSNVGGTAPQAFRYPRGFIDTIDRQTLQQRSRKVLACRQPALLDFTTMVVA